MHWMFSELFTVELLKSAVHFPFEDFVRGTLDPCVDDRVLEDWDFQLSRRFHSGTGTRTFTVAR